LTSRLLLTRLGRRLSWSGLLLFSRYPLHGGFADFDS
jgi:hypothetical protein